VSDIFADDFPRNKFTGGEHHSKQHAHRQSIEKMHANEEEQLRRRSLVQDARETKQLLLLRSRLRGDWFMQSL